MKFGVFLPNGSNGYIISKAVKPYLPTFEHNKAITLEAEKQDLDFVLSMMKFRGFGGETGYWDACLESFTLMAGLASVTDKIGLIPSIALLSQHPAYVARMMATLDDISGGRCGLNIVTGWNKPEYTQMGLWRGDEYYDRRYEYAADYLTILQDLWRNGTSTHHSEFFDLEDCSCLPMPGRELEIVCAGQSPKGVEFVAKNADHNFVMAQPPKLKGISDSLKAKGSEQGRDVGTYALFGLITANTDAEAFAMGQKIIDEADEAAISNIIASASLDSNAGGTADHLKAGLALGLEEGNMAFMGFPVICGSFDTVAQKIDAIAEDTGVDGMLFSWADFVGGIRDFGEQIKPRLKCSVSV
ncbi:MAG: LLM class flavin-dependent oxidoreductase [Rhodospirillaceae bacterium]|nr:LLM class flavin-dependent oxidoreductase [Rhodospirillaceae bacterium]